MAPGYMDQAPTKANITAASSASPTVPKTQTQTQTQAHAHTPLGQSTQKSEEHKKEAKTNDMSKRAQPAM